MDFSTEIIELIRKHALINAYEHEGRAAQGPVLSKVMAERPELRARARELAKLVLEVVNEVNRMSFDDIRREVEEKHLVVPAKRRVVEEKTLPPLPNADKYEVIVTRFAPNPDAPLHIGSLRPLILSHEYARMYRGKFILRFEDTDPKTKKPIPEAYKWIMEDMEWLEIKADEVIYQSDRLEIYYDVAKKLIEREGAYVCTCRQEVFKVLRDSGEPCRCRLMGIEDHLKRFEDMLSRRYREKESVVRIKTDLKHPDISVRDWVAFRIIDTDKHPHPRVGSKYFVWPTYNFACAVDDHLLDVSHILRAKEHIANTVKQRYIFEHMNWRFPETIHFGRLKLANIILSKSQISRGILRGDFWWWDDPRLGTVMAVRRRGILPETLKEIILHVGIKVSEASISWENIYSTNRKHLDPIADRFFCVLEPIVMIVTRVPSSYVAKPPMHPDYPKRGFREIEVKVKDSIAELYVSRRDIKVLKENSLVRLMSLFNVEVVSVEDDVIKATYRGESVEEATQAKAPIIQWVPVNNNVKVEVVMPNASIARGVGEKALSSLRINTIVQFVRVGFARLDDKSNEMLRFYFAHE